MPDEPGVRPHNPATNNALPPVVIAPADRLGVKEDK